jgi:hypothetical protein
MKALKRLAIVTAAGVGLALTAALGGNWFSSPAQAATYYWADLGRVCNFQYPRPGEFVHYSTWRPWDPYSAFCTKQSVWDPRPMSLGGLNIQAYCSATIPGSRAAGVRRGAYALDDWYCVR